MVFSSAKTLLQRQFKELNEDPNSFFSCELVNDDIFQWRVSFPGPEMSLYESGFYSAILKFPDDFPNYPPVMNIEQKLFHPNVYENGEVCISILHPPGADATNTDEKEEERWRPILGVEAILISVISMLCDPNLASPANVDAAKMMRDDYDGYKRLVRRLAEETLS